MSETITSVERAFAVVRALARAESSLGVSAIARATDLPKSTVARLLTTLEVLEMVERVDARGRYTVGPGVATLSSGGAVGRVRDLARPFLRELVEEIGEDAGLAVPDGDALLFIDQVQGRQPVQIQDWTGQRSAYHTVAAGFVIMGDWSDRQLSAFLRSGLEQPTDHTVVDPDGLRARIEEANRVGYAWTRDEWRDGITGAAAPIRAVDGSTVAAINLYGPSYRFPGRRDADRIGRRLAEVGEVVGRLLT